MSRVDFIITINDMGIETKYGEYGGEERGKTISGVLRLGGSIVPARPPDVLWPSISKMFDEAFGTVKEAVARASSERAESEEESGW